MSRRAQPSRGRAKYRELGLSLSGDDRALTDYGGAPVHTIEILPEPHEGFAGHVSPQVAHATLLADSAARMIDVRTRAEWAFVGVPRLCGSVAPILFIEWQTYPEMSENSAFVPDVRATLASDVPVFLICRSGSRSVAAARVLSDAGFTSAFNISGGFEGDLDPNDHRGARNGWKYAHLDWGQT